MIVSRPHRKSGFNDERLWRLVLLGLLVGGWLAALPVLVIIGVSLSLYSLPGSASRQALTESLRSMSGRGRVSARPVSRPWSEISGSSII